MFQHQNDDEEEEDDDDDDDDDAFDDDYFDIPGPNGFNDTEFVPGGGRPGSRPRPPRRRPPFFHCVMGGYGPNGPMPTVSHVIPSARRLPRYLSYTSCIDLKHWNGHS